MRPEPPDREQQNASLRKRHSGRKRENHTTAGATHTPEPPDREQQNASLRKSTGEKNSTAPAHSSSADAVIAAISHCTLELQAQNAVRKRQQALRPES